MSILKQATLISLSSLMLLGSNVALANNGDFYDTDGKAYKSSAEVLSKTIEVNKVLSNTSKYAMKLDSKIYSLNTIMKAYKDHGDKYLENISKYPNIKDTDTDVDSDFIVVEIE